MALTLFALISTLALSSQSAIVLKSRRFEAQTALLAWAAHLEHLYLVNQTYTQRDAERFKQRLNQKHYAFKLNLSDQQYWIEAIPKTRQQKKDHLCVGLYLDHTGRRWHTGSGSLEQCWA